MTTKTPEQRDAWLRIFCAALPVGGALLARNIPLLHNDQPVQPHEWAACVASETSLALDHWSGQAGDMPPAPVCPGSSPRAWPAPPVPDARPITYLERDTGQFYRVYSTDGKLSREAYWGHGYWRDINDRPVLDFEPCWFTSEQDPSL